jgi:hypothetical protein
MKVRLPFSILAVSVLLLVLHPAPAPGKNRRISRWHQAPSPKLKPSSRTLIPSPKRRR